MNTSLSPQEVAALDQIDATRRDLIKHATHTLRATLRAGFVSEEAGGPYLAALNSIRPEDVVQVLGGVCTMLASELLVHDDAEYVCDCQGCELG